MVKQDGDVLAWQSSLLTTPRVGCGGVPGFPEVWSKNVAGRLNGEWGPPVVISVVAVLQDANASLQIRVLQ